MIRVKFIEIFVVVIAVDDERDQTPDRRCWRMEITIVVSHQHRECYSELNEGD